MISSVTQDVDPAQWRLHRFGLAADRWARLEGKGIWITGAGTGYGRCISIACAAAGAYVYLTGRRDAKLAESLSEMKSLGIDAGRCRLVAADVTNPAAIEGAIAAIEAERGSLSGLVHCAALPQDARFRRPLLEMSASAVDRIWQTNYMAPWLTTRAAIPCFERSGEAHIAMVSSLAGWANTLGYGAYNVSKAALNSLGSSLGVELAAAYPTMDVQVNVLVAGEARTEMNQGSTISPFTICSAALLLLTHPPGGPNGRFFHQDGRKLAFGSIGFYERTLVD